MGGYFYRCVKYTFIVLNSTVWVIGACILGFGIWLSVDQNNLEYIQGNFPQTDKVNLTLFVTPAHSILIAAGALVFILAFFGCFGVGCEKQWSLGFYTVFMLVITGLTITGGVYLGLELGKLTKNLGEGLRKSMQRDYNGHNDVSVIWNRLMIEFDCCGVQGPQDWKATQWTLNQTAQGLNDVVPKACCMLTVYDAEKPEPKDNGACQADVGKAESVNLRVKGCSDIVHDWLETRFIALIIVTFSVAGIEALTVIFTMRMWCFIRQKRGRSGSVW